MRNPSTRRQLLADPFEGSERPDPYLPPSIGHHTERIQAIKTGGTTSRPFEYSGPLAEGVLLGVVSYRSGTEPEFDAKPLRVVNSIKARGMLHKEYRKGWTL